MTDTRTPLTRRAVLAGAGASAALVALAPRLSLAANPAGTELHGLSAFGELKYAPGFTQFDYASPGAPQGGTFRFQPPNWLYNQNVDTFDTLNSFVLKGTAPPRMELCFDTLMVEALDEPDSLYCSLSRSVTIAADRNTYTFRLRPEARFADGAPVTAEDVAGSFRLIKAKGHPALALDLARLADARATAADTVEIVFDGRQSDRAILAVASTVPVLPMAWIGARDFESITAKAIPGSGPYRVAAHSFGTFIEYERRADDWAKDLFFRRGLDRFDRLRIDFFRDRTPAFEAFKKGEIDWRQEFTSRVWANDYNFPAVTDGRVKKLEVPSTRNPDFYGWAFNTRRAKFADPRTRRAIARLFDFEWINRNLFYGIYERSQSMFENSEFVAEGMPSPAELALLEPLRAQLPEAVFGEPASLPATDGSGRDRAGLREAGDLLAQAGWRREGGRWLDAAGEPLTVEFLINSETFERVLAPWRQALEAAGIAASIRLVDAAQYQARTDGYDFDLTSLAYSLSPTPTGESMHQFFHSQTATRNGGTNYPGIADPAMDALVEAVGRAASRDELVAALRAMDRVMRAQLWWMPSWKSAADRIAFWDRFAWKEPMPPYGHPVERLWWRDPAKG